MKKTRFLIFGLIFALTFMFAACGNGADDGNGAADKDTLVYGSGDYTGINPALYEHGEINSLLFAGLTAHDENNKVVPGLAESWEYDEEGLTYTFILRDGLTFHDGKPLTSEDVIYTLETILDENNGSEIISNYENISEMTAVDEKTVEIKLDKANTAMLDYLTIGILPKHLLENEDIITSDFNKSPVGAGPYKLSSWDRGQSITMEKFPDFYLGEPNIDEVIFKIVEDYDARALQLKSGDLDFAQITPKSADELKSEEGLITVIMDTADYRGIMYNFNSDFFGENKNLPAALSYAIDREGIIKSVLLGYGQPAYSPLQKSEYANSDVEKYSYDPDKAKYMIEELGWTLGENGYYEKNGKELAFEICNGEGDQVRIDMSNICAQNLQDIGVNATVKVSSEVDWENQDAYLIGWGSPFDPDDHTYKVFGTNQAANYSGYSDERVDALLLKGRSLTSHEERLTVYKEFQKALSENPPYTFIAYVDAIYAVKEGISGYTEKTVLGHHGVGIFWNIYEWEIE